jgi:ABC-type Mn2+/Zn2+ transport system permease subunit
LFVLEGFIIGILSFLIAFLFTFSFGIFFGDKINNLIPSLDIFNYLKNNFLFILSTQLIIGVILGVFSSIIAVSKHFKY